MCYTGSNPKIIKLTCTWTPMTIFVFETSVSGVILGRMTSYTRMRLHWPSTLGILPSFWCLTWSWYKRLLPSFPSGYQVEWLVHGIEYGRNNPQPNLSTYFLMFILFLSFQTQVHIVKFGAFANGIHFNVSIKGLILYPSLSTMSATFCFMCHVTWNRKLLMKASCSRSWGRTLIPDVPHSYCHLTLNDQQQQTHHNIPLGDQHSHNWLCGLCHNVPDHRLIMLAQNPHTMCCYEYSVTRWLS